MHNKVIGYITARHHLIRNVPIIKRGIKGSLLLQFTRYHHPNAKRQHVKLFSDTAHKDPPTGPLFDNHNNTFETTTSQGKYGSTEVLNKNLDSDTLPSVELAYEVINQHTSQFDKEKPSIILLHGLFGNKQNNRTIGRELNELLERDVYLPDLRNHGQSPHIGRHDYPSMALDVERFVREKILNHNDAKKPIIIGHSMGAKVAMSTVLRKPELYSMLVSIDNAPVASPPMTAFPRYVKKLLQIINNPNVGTVQQADEQLKEIEPSTLVRRFLLTILQRVRDEESGSWRFKSKIPLGILNDAIVKGNISNWEFNPWVHRFGGPSLFIRGTKSYYVADEYISDIGNFFPRFEVRDIEAGHWVNSEKPHECVRDIVEFVERHEDELRFN